MFLGINVWEWMVVLLYACLLNGTASLVYSSDKPSALSAGDLWSLRTDKSILWLTKWFFSDYLGRCLAFWVRLQAWSETCSAKCDIYSWASKTVFDFSAGSNNRQKSGNDDLSARSSAVWCNNYLVQTSNHVLKPHTYIYNCALPPPPPHPPLSLSLCDFKKLSPSNGVNDMYHEACARQNVSKKYRFLYSLFFFFFYHWAS